MRSIQNLLNISRKINNHANVENITVATYSEHLLNNSLLELLRVMASLHSDTKLSSTCTTTTSDCKDKHPSTWPYQNNSLVY